MDAKTLEALQGFLQENPGQAVCMEGLIEWKRGREAARVAAEVAAARVEKEAERKRKDDEKKAAQERSR